MLAKLEELMTQLDDRYSIVAGNEITPKAEDAQSTAADRDSIVYFYYKFMYTKAKTLRKTRKL